MSPRSSKNMSFPFALDLTYLIELSIDVRVIYIFFNVLTNLLVAYYIIYYVVYFGNVVM